MRFLFSFLVVVLTLAFLITTAIYLVGRVLRDVRWAGSSPSAFRDALEHLRQQVKKLTPELVPWDGEMFSLLSLLRSPERSKGRFQRVTQGYLLSIFQEPVVAFAVQGQGNHRIALARTHDREFAFRQKGKKEVEIWLNGNPLGVLVDNTLLSPDKGGRLLARIDEKPSESYSEISLADGRSISLANRAQAKGPIPRAVVLAGALSPEEENIALALTLLRLLP